MSQGPWGVPPPPPITESKFFNAARRTVSLLVEAGVDQRFWRMHRARDCLVRHHGQGGREAVLKELQRGREQPDVVLLAVLDADLDRLEGRLPSDPDVVWTDGHDLETTLLCLPTLGKLVAQRVDSKKLAEKEAAWGETFRARLFRHAEGMGRLRWLKQREGIDALVFKKAQKSKHELLLFGKYDDCCDKDWSPSLACVIKALINYNNAHELRERDLVSECAALPTAEADQVCNGHDLVGFLLAGLKAMSGARPRETAEELLEVIAGFCERAWLERTEMWQAIQAWEAAHPGYQVLAEA